MSNASEASSAALAQATRNVFNYMSGTTITRKSGPSSSNNIQEDLSELALYNVSGPSPSLDKIQYNSIYQHVRRTSEGIINPSSPIRQDGSGHPRDEKEFLHSIISILGSSILLDTYDKIKPIIDETVDTLVESPVYKEAKERKQRITLTNIINSFESCSNTNRPRKRCYL